MLSALPIGDWNRFRGEAEHIELKAGLTLIPAGGPVASVYFPTTGLISVLSALPSGHVVEVAAVGCEGLIGVGAVLGVQRSPYWVVVQVTSTGYRVPADIFYQLFNESETLRRLTLAHIGRLLVDVARSASCNRFHSHRERLARWLLATMDKSGQRSLDLTHDFIAQMVGGPRHAVTAALNYLKASGAIAAARGRIEISDAEQLVHQACDCYRPSR